MSKADPRNFIIANQSIAFVSDFGEKNSSPEQPIKIDAKKVFPAYIDDFSLRKAGIIDKAWELAEKPQIDQPFLSQLKYDNGISFTAEINRLVYSDAQPKKFEQDKDFYKRATKLAKYVGQSGIKISAVGTNFGLLMPKENADEYLYDLCLNKQIFSKLEKAVKSPNLRVSYNLEDDITLNINLFSSSKAQVINYPFEEGNCVVLDANFDCKIENIANLTVEGAINQALSRFDVLKKLFVID